MKTSKCLMTWGLLSWLALSLPACSGDEVPEALSGTEQTAQASQGQITLKIQAPVPESVVLTKATYQTAEEARVYQLGIYIFEKGSGSTDADYTFSKFLSFGDLNGNSSLVGENGTGTFVTNIPIEDTWKGETIKVLLTANEEVAQLDNTTTLEVFKKTLLRRELIEPANADMLVMNESGRGTRMQFPMSATAYQYASGNSQEITIPEGDNPSITLAASLVRCLARVDVFNDTPNLTITSVRASNAHNKGSLFNLKNEAVVVPINLSSEFGKVSLNPLKSYFNGAAKIPYVTPVNPDDVNSRRAANTRTAFYLCEQDVDAAATSPVISIGYTLDIEGKSKPGMVSVYFRDGTNFQDVVRNTLYRIRLGDGTKVDSDMSVRIEVDDWDSEEIYAVLDPTTDGSGD